MFPAVGRTGRFMDPFHRGPTKRRPHVARGCRTKERMAPRCAFRLVYSGASVESFRSVLEGVTISPRVLTVALTSVATKEHVHLILSLCISVPPGAMPHRRARAHSRARRARSERSHGQRRELAPIESLSGDDARALAAVDALSDADGDKSAEATDPGACPMPFTTHADSMPNPKSRSKAKLVRRHVLGHRSSLPAPLNAAHSPIAHPNSRHRPTPRHVHPCWAATSHPCASGWRSGEIWVLLRLGRCLCEGMMTRPIALRQCFCGQIAQARDCCNVKSRVSVAHVESIGMMNTGAAESIGLA